MNRFSLSREASEDVLDVWDYLAGRAGEKVADGVVEKLYQAFAFLADYPDSGTSRNDLRPGIRLFSPGKPASAYVVAFRPRNDIVEILRVLHGARDYAKLLAYDS